MTYNNTKIVLLSNEITSGDINLKADSVGEFQKLLTTDNNYPLKELQKLKQQQKQLNDDEYQEAIKLAYDEFYNYCNNVRNFLKSVGVDCQGEDYDISMTYTKDYGCVPMLSPSNIKNQERKNELLGFADGDLIDKIKNDYDEDIKVFKVKSGYYVSDRTLNPRESSFIANEGTITRLHQMAGTKELEAMTQELYAQDPFNKFDTVYLNDGACKISISNNGIDIDKNNTIIDLTQNNTIKEAIETLRGNIVIDLTQNNKYRNTLSR